MSDFCVKDLPRVDRLDFQDLGFVAGNQEVALSTRNMPSIFDGDLIEFLRFIDQPDDCIKDLNLFKARANKIKEILQEKYSINLDQELQILLCETSVGVSTLEYQIRSNATDGAAATRTHIFGKLAQLKTAIEQHFSNVNDLTEKLDQINVSTHDQNSSKLGESMFAGQIVRVKNSSKVKNRTNVDSKIKPERTVQFKLDPQEIFARKSIAHHVREYFAGNLPNWLKANLYETYNKIEKLIAKNLDYQVATRKVLDRIVEKRARNLIDKLQDSIQSSKVAVVMGDKNLSGRALLRDVKTLIKLGESPNRIKEEILGKF